MFAIRRAGIPDLMDILSVFDDARAFIASYGSDQWQDGYPDSDVILSDIVSEYGYIVEDDNGIHAYAAIIPDIEPAYAELDKAGVFTHEQYLTVHRVALDNTCRGKGIGSMLLKFAQSEAVRRKLPAIRMDTHRKNIAMQRLLQKNGFVYRGDAAYPSTSGDPIRICFENVL